MGLSAAQSTWQSRPAPRAEPGIGYTLRVKVTRTGALGVLAAGVVLVSAAVWWTGRPTPALPSILRVQDLLLQEPIRQAPVPQAAAEGREDLAMPPIERVPQREDPGPRHRWPEGPGALPHGISVSHLSAHLERDIASYVQLLQAAEFEDDGAPRDLETIATYRVALLQARLSRTALSRGLFVVTDRLGPVGFGPPPGHVPLRLLDGIEGVFVYPFLPGPVAELDRLHGELACEAFNRLSDGMRSRVLRLRESDLAAGEDLAWCDEYFPRHVQIDAQAHRVTLP